MTGGGKADRGASIRLDGVGFAYPGGAEMRFDLAVEAGERLALMGPSGSGKTTILNLIAGFERPAAGAVMIAGRDVGGLPPSERPVSMVFQENNLFAHLDVADNVGLGRSPSLRLSAADREAISEALRRTGLEGKEKRLPGALSGGERQRVALARVLVRDQPVLLLDEAFAALGPALRDEMLELVLALHADNGMTIVDATHDPFEAGRIATSIAYVEEGRIAARGSAKEFLAGMAPEGFQRYLGSGGVMRQGGTSARKPT